MKLQLLIAIFLIAINCGAVFSLKCLKCDSTTNANCIKDLSQINAEDCGDEKFKFCSTEVDDNGKVTRGCRESSDQCTSGKCLSCDTDDCNKHNVCQTCDSSKDCVNLETFNAKFNQICEKSDTKCLININSDKKIVRRCASDKDVTDCTNGETCQTCTGGNCNLGVFPTNRKRCYQCTEENSNCAHVQTNNDLKSEPCTLYDKDDKCYMIGTDSSKITRGCVSDLSDQHKCKAATPDKTCYFCNASNCNEYSFNRTQQLKCIQCKKDDKDCAWGHKESDAKNCNKDIEYYKEEKCYILKKDSDVERGCFYDVYDTESECKSENGCTTCNNGDGCNKADENDFTCIICRSDVNKKCYDGADTLPGDKCRNAVSADKNKCFHGIWNGVVIRGCLVDADERAQALCLDDKNKQCITCDGKDCNKAKTSGASSLSAMAGFILLILTILIQKF